MASTKYQLTAKKVEEMQAKLAEMENEGRKRIADELDISRDDMSDEDDTAVSELLIEKEYLETEIANLKEILSNYELIDIEAAGSVGLGCTVRVSVDGKRQVYQIVSEIEADPLSGKISDQSPLGKALIGRKVGDKSELDVEGNVKKLRVLEITC